VEAVTAVGKPKVPDTIGKEHAAKLKAAGAKQNWFTAKAVAQRKASEQQRKNAGKN
jgi:hypothetical protein